MGTIRDAQKFPQRDMRKDINKLDKLNFNLLSPYTVQKMFRAVATLKRLQQTCGETSETYTYQSCKIKNASLRSGLKLYDIAICKFLGNSIISRLAECSCRNDDEIRRCLKPDMEEGVGDWLDLSGLLAPKSEVYKLIEGIEEGRIAKIKEINAVFDQLHSSYYSLEWTWAWDKIQKYYNVDIGTITVADIIGIVERWKDAVISLDRMIYEDAKKEFSLSAQTSFGIDGNSDEQKVDFEQVRGAFEKNAFVEAVLKHIKDKEALGNELINRLNQAR